MLYTTPNRSASGSSIFHKFPGTKYYERIFYVFTKKNQKNKWIIEEPYFMLIPLHECKVQVYLLDIVHDSSRKDFLGEGPVSIEE